MNKSNSKSETANSHEEFTKIISEAKLSHQRSRDGAMEAAANAYMLWLCTQSAHATKSAGDWLEKEIEAANEVISSHNEKTKTLQERVKAFQEGKLKDEDPLNEKPRDPQHALEIEKGKEELRACFSWDKKDWARGRKMKIEARDGASSFTRIVKFVFGFDEVQHSDQVARYALVLEWINSQFVEDAPDSSDDVLAALKDAGGFEDVIYLQRQSKAGLAESSDDRKLINDAIREDIKHALANLTPIGSIPVEARHDQDGFVVVLGRKAGTSINLIGEVQLTESEMQSAISSIGADIDIPNQSSSEFVARVLELGRLVTEGQETRMSRDGTSEGDKVKVQRVVAYRPGLDRQPEFVISARATDASAIVYAWPKNTAELGIPSKPLMLNNPNRKRMEMWVRDQNVRRHIAIQADHEPKRADGSPAESPMAWISGNAILLSRSSKNATQQFFWSDLSHADFKPLDLDNFQPQFNAAIDDVDLDWLFMDRLKAWGASKSPTKQAMTATLKFDADKLEILIKDHEALDIKLAKPVTGRFTLSFRIRDLYDLVQSLLKQRASQFDLSGDEGGLLSVSWSDALGSYAVYLPTVGADGRLQSRRMSPMRVSAPATMAAE